MASSKRRKSSRARTSGGAGVPVYYLSQEEMETFSLPDFMSSVWDNVYPVGAFKVVMTDEFHRSASLASPDRGWDLSFVPPPPTSSSPSSEDMHNAPADNPAHTAMVAAPMRQIANGSKGVFRQTFLSEPTRPLELYYAEAVAHRMEHRPETLDRMAENPAACVARLENDFSDSDDDPTAAFANEAAPKVELCKFSDYDRKAEYYFWRGLSYRRPLYGADVNGTLFAEDAPRGWNLRHVAKDSLLQHVEEEIFGVTSPMLYYGMYGSVFSWHTEDMDLCSTSYLHHGAPKQWYIIPEPHRLSFESLLMASIRRGDLECANYVRHKQCLISPRALRDAGIPFHRIVQRQNEFVVVLPGVYHAGFNQDFNIAESVNFATREWLPFGRNAKACQCMSNTAVFDMDRFERLARGLRATPTPPPRSPTPPPVYARRREEPRRKSKHKKKAKKAKKAKKKKKKKNKHKTRTRSPAYSFSSYPSYDSYSMYSYSWSWAPSSQSSSGSERRRHSRRHSRRRSDRADDSIRKRVIEHNDRPLVVTIRPPAPPTSRPASVVAREAIAGLFPASAGTDVEADIVDGVLFVEFDEAPVGTPTDASLPQRFAGAASPAVALSDVSAPPDVLLETSAGAAAASETPKAAGSKRTTSDRADERGWHLGPTRTGGASLDGPGAIRQQIPEPKRVKREEMGVVW